MTTEQTAVEWRIIGETVAGATHLRNQIPNQDAILHVRESSRELPIILSVSDGHGSPKCFRSHRGSRFAVKKAAYLLGEFLDERGGKFDLAEIETQKDYLAAEFVARWRAAVEADLKKEPFQVAEFENLEKKADAKARKSIEDNPLLAYGATSLTIACLPDFVIYLQLGDGDILNVSDAGAITKPLAEDRRLLANETTSLCLPDAAKDFRFAVQKITPENSPAMILLSTDGYLNSFSTEAGFFQAATDILTMLRGENGFDDVSANLKAWLEEATRLGSGDDCTIGIVYRPQVLSKQAAIAQTAEPAATIAPQIETFVSPTKVQPPDNAVELLPDNAPNDPEDVTVTITIKKDKTAASPAVTIKQSADKAGDDKPANDAPEEKRK